MMRVREYVDADDLRVMQVAASRIWSPESRWHVGDLAWGRFQHAGREREWPTALWITPAGEPVAWGWVQLPAHLDLLVDPAHPELAADVLTWFDDVADHGRRTVTVLESEDHLLVALRTAGYTEQPDVPYLRHCVMPLEQLPEPGLPDRFALRPVAAADVAERVRVHRTAFAPSRVTADSYRAVRSAWPYRADLDVVIEAPDGTFVAFALGWIDDRNRVGELEPVGVDPRFRGLGLGRAVSLAALHALRAARADRCVVYPRGDPAHPGPLRLYRALGFVPGPRTVTVTR